MNSNKCTVTTCYILTVNIALVRSVGYSGGGGTPLAPPFNRAPLHPKTVFFLGCPKLRTLPSDGGLVAEQLTDGHLFVLLTTVECTIVVLSSHNSSLVDEKAL